MKKAKFALAALAACMMLAPVTALAEDAKYEEGWQQGSGGWWYQFEDGSYAEDGYYYIDEDGNGIIDEDENEAYMFDANGYLTTGWYNDGDYWYYSDPSTGVLQDGWVMIGGSWFYFAEAESYYSNFTMSENDVYSVPEGKDEDGYTEYVDYLFGKDGALVYGWHFTGDEYNYGRWYYSDPNTGVVVKGWKQIDGLWYYFSTYNGYMFNDGVYSICDNPDADYEDQTYTNYRFANSGVMVSGWYNASPYSTYGDWYYSNPDGSVEDEAYWLASGGKWYWINAYGSMATNTTVYLLEDEEGNVYNSTSTWVSGYYDEDDNYVYGYYAEILDEYYVGRDGAMIEGWYYSESYDDTGYYSDCWMYAWVGGSIQAGWIQSGADWYFINENGYMVRGGSYFTGDYDNAPASPEYPEYTGPEYPDSDDFEDEDGNVDYDAYWDAYDAYWEAREAYWDEVDKYYDAYDQWEIDYQDWYTANVYVFDASGRMCTGGWYGYTSQWGTTWYYSNVDGTGYDGWLNDGGTWYYIQNGLMLRSQYTPDGYWVDANGIYQ